MIIRYKNKFTNLVGIDQFSVGVDRPNSDVYQVMLWLPDGLTVQMEKFLSEKEAHMACLKVANCICKALGENTAVLTVR